VDRHRIDTDPDPNFYADADPDPDPDPDLHQNDADPHASLRILPHVLHKLENKRKNYFYSQQCQFTMIFLYHQWQRSHPFKGTVQRDRSDRN
jgi:hypothetical protein